MKRILITLLMLAAAVAANAQATEFERNSFVSSDGISLNYRSLAPENIATGKKYPVVLYLHGAGERGNDNELQLFHGGQMFLNPVNREKYPAFVIFPQCPKENFWAFRQRPDNIGIGIPAEDEIAPVLKAVVELLQSYMENPAVDKFRIYVMGMSMGGMATYDLVARYPDLFAAAIPICGAVKPGRIGIAKDVKFRIYHGDADNVVPFECSRAAYKELKAAGISVEYFEFPGCKHNSWTPAFNQPDFMEWLFAQKRKVRRTMGLHR